MAYLGNAPARSFISFERQVFTIVNSQTAYTLDHSVNNENDLRLVINNIVQEPGSGKAYTALGTTLTLSAALTNGTDEMYCVFLGRATATNAPGAGSVGASQLASDAVTTAKILDSNITTAKILDSNITTAKIADNAVTSAKLTYPLTTFSSTGIDDNADATAITIDSSESLGLGTTSPFNSNAGSFTISNDAPTIYMEDTNASSRKVGQILYNDTNLTFSIGDRNGTDTSNSIELLKINNAGKIFTRQTAQFDDCVTIGGSPFTGDFQIEVSGLTAVNGGSWKQIGMRLSYAGIQDDAAGAQTKDVLITIRGLSSYSSVTGVDTGGGTVSITADSSTTTASTFTITSPSSTCVGAYVATLFANDDSTMECNA
jgi:hypothetical protein